jgi:branched-subunit amino acid transport protein
MGMLRALLVFVVFWALFALLIQGLLHLGRRQRWQWMRLVGVSAAAATLAAGLLWAVVALF